MKRTLIKGWPLRYKNKTVHCLLHTINDKYKWQFLLSKNENLYSDYYFKRSELLVSFLENLQSSEFLWVFWWEEYFEPSYSRLKIIFIGQTSLFSLNLMFDKRFINYR